MDDTKKSKFAGRWSVITKLVIFITCLFIAVIIQRSFSPVRTPEEYLKRFPLQKEFSCTKITLVEVPLVLSQVFIRPGVAEGTFMVGGVNAQSEDVSYIVNGSGKIISRYMIPESTTLSNYIASLDYVTKYDKGETSSNVSYSNQAESIKSFPDGGGTLVTTKNLTVNSESCGSKRYYILSSVKISDTLTALSFEMSNSYVANQSAVIGIVGD